MRRDVGAEQKYREEFKEEIGRAPTEAEVNVAVYGTQMPAFRRTRAELAMFRVRALWLTVAKAAPFLLDIVKYALGTAAGLAIFYAARNLF